MNRYNHEHDCPFELQINDINSLNGKKWIKMPLNDSQLSAINNDIKIIDVDVYVNGMYEVISESRNITELNALAKMIISLSDSKYYKLCNTLESEIVDNAKDVIHLINRMN